MNVTTQHMIPSLETERLRLIPPTLECFELYERFYTDVKASELYGGPLSIEQSWARLKADLGSWHLLKFGVWIIQLRSDNSLVGTCGFWQGRNWPRELTWWLLPEARSRGYAKEASIAALRHAYEFFGWETVETYMNDENKAARNLVIKLGGKKIDRKQFPDGLSRDIFVIPKAE